MFDFITSCIGHLENISSLNNINLPNVDPVHYIISKNHITISHKKTTILERCQAPW